MIRILSGAALTLLALALLLAMTVDAVAPGLFLSLASYAALLAGMVLAATGAASLPRRGGMTDGPDHGPEQDEISGSRKRIARVWNLTRSDRALFTVSMEMDSDSGLVSRLEVFYTGWPRRCSVPLWGTVPSAIERDPGFRGAAPTDVELTTLDSRNSITSDCRRDRYRMAKTAPAAP